jgi:branched-chain amino acid transport system substrate-binding protein
VLGLAAVCAKTATGLGIAIAGSQTFDYGASSYAPLVDRVAAAKPDALFIAGILSPNTATMVKELRAALGPGVRILATDGFSGFPLVRILLGTTAEGMLISEAGVPNSQLPASGRKFVTAFSKAVDETPGSYPAYAAQAAEALLDAIARSHGTRASVAAQLFKTRVSNGILGSFAIDRYGDTTAATITVYRFAGGAARVFRVITPKPSGTR